MNNSDKGFTFDIETGITLDELQAALLYGAVMKLYLIKDDVSNNWFVKVFSSNGSNGYLLNSRGRMKSYASLDTAVRQLSELAPESSISIHR